MIVKPPNPHNIAEYDDIYRIFLAGSIEMGTAEKWQDKVCKAVDSDKVLLLNPLREDWDNSWKQEITNPQFHEQVTWELAGIEQADLVIFYFDPNTKSPITLMELGLCARQHRFRTIVCCPEGFWRKGNVDIVCEKFGIKMVETLDKLIEQVIMLI